MLMRRKIYLIMIFGHMKIFWKIKDEKLFVQILSPILTHPDYLSDVIDGINTDYILDNKAYIQIIYTNDN